MERLRILLLPLSSLGLFCGCSGAAISRSSAEEEIVVGGIDVSEAIAPVERSVSEEVPEVISSVVAGDINLGETGGVDYMNLGQERGWFPDRQGCGAERGPGGRA